jgi:hypothetical protein
MSARRERAIQFGVIVVVAILTQILYPYAILKGRPNLIFGGIFFNSYDGYSYLAKMYQGWQGSWKYTLLYSPGQDYGSYLFMYYLFLGHVSRWTGLPLPITYHLARFLSTVLFYFVLFKFLKKVLIDPRLYISAYLLAAFGSGLGWLSLFFNKITPDFWVAEAYPFLSSFANPHFPLGLALLLWLFSLESSREIKIYPKAALQLIGGSFLLAVVLPFGVIVYFAVILLSDIFEWIIHFMNKDQWSFQHYRFLGLEIVFVVLGGITVLFYQFWLTRTDPLLSIWNVQNVTPAPPIGDLMIALLPVGFIAIAGIFSAIKEKKHYSIRVLFWAVVGIGFIYIPFSLQRRLILGVYIPVVILAVWGMDYLVRNVFKANNNFVKFKSVIFILLLFSIPTNLIILFTTKNAIDRYDSKLYLTSGEINAFKWLVENTPKQSCILSSPESGLFIPAFTGEHVVYGHPFETINADVNKQFVLDFFTQMIRANDKDKLHNILNEYRVDYIYFGPREKKINGDDASLLLQEQFDRIYQNEEVQIYRVIK